MLLADNLSIDTLEYSPIIWQGNCCLWKSYSYPPKAISGCWWIYFLKSVAVLRVGSKSIPLRLYLRKIFRAQAQVTFSDYNLWSSICQSCRVMCWSYKRVSYEISLYITGPEFLWPFLIEGLGCFQYFLRCVWFRYRAWCHYRRWRRRGGYTIWQWLL